MAENTNIEWATHTFNPWMGCQKVGPGCDHCYAEVWDDKAGGESRWGPHATRTRSKQGNWDRVVTWNSKARDAGIRETVFVASLADVFDTHNSILPEWRADLAALVKKCENLDFMFLTKRAGNVEKLLGKMFPEGAPGNLWIGATIVNQEEADRDITKLLDAKYACGIRVAFLSIEPMLGPIDLTSLGTSGNLSRLNGLTGDIFFKDPQTQKLDFCIGGKKHIDWVIVGGETGIEARPMHIDWARSLRDQCAEAGTPFLFKQWGNWFPYGEMDASGAMNSVTRGEKHGVWHEWDGEVGFSVYFDKKIAGRFLDERTWDGLPLGTGGPS